MAKNSKTRKRNGGINPRERKFYLRGVLLGDDSPDLDMLDEYHGTDEVSVEGGVIRLGEVPISVSEW